MSFKIKEAHWHVILEYMIKNPELARGRLSTSQARKDYNRMWGELTSSLNSLGLGQKPVDKWQKSWTDYKLNLKKKAAEIEKYRTLTGGGPACQKSLTDFELKILELLGETFYKGIGSKELGLPPASPDNILVLSSTEMSEATPDVLTSRSTLTKAVDFPILELPKQSEVQIKPPVEFRKKPRVEKRPFNNTFNDHDYLPQLPQTATRSSENAEVKEIYEETLTALHSINENVSKIAQNLGELTEHFKNFSSNFEKLLNRSSQNNY